MPTISVEGMEWKFQFKLRTLKLVGSDMVFGVNWMCQFSPFLLDFIQGCIKINGKNGEIELSEMPEHSVLMMEIERI